MTTHDDELLSQYLDGELSTPEAQKLELRLTVEPQLKSALTSIQQMNDTLRSALTSDKARTVPARVVAMLSRSDNNRIIPFPKRQTKSSWGFAIAASIMAASGLLLIQGTGQQLAGSNAAPAQPNVQLSQILENTPSQQQVWSLLSDGSQVMPVLTYATTNGNWCREYMLADDSGSWRGVACRNEGGDWSTEVLGAQPSMDVSNEYRTAGASDSSEVAKFMDVNAADIALSVAKEEELIATGWR